LDARTAMILDGSGRCAPGAVPRVPTRMPKHPEDSPSAALRRAARLVPLCLVAALAACAQRGAAAGPDPGFTEFAGREVKSVTFTGERVVREDSLRKVISTQASSCRTFGLPVCLFGLGRERHRFDPAELTRDVARIQLEHRDHGYYGTRVVPAVEAVGDEAVAVRFGIVPGDRITVRALDVTGTEEIIPPDDLERAVPLREGQPFRRNGFLASADTIRARLLDRGYVYAQVLRNYSLDTIADLADVGYEAVPGQLVRVDSVVVLGGERLGERTVRRQLSVREGNLLRASELNRSQRNLYDFQMVNFASVEIAPDSLQLDPDSARSTVLVRVVEAPQYLAEVSGGYGTIDCLRTEARRLDRNFLSGGRTLEISGSLSKIGTGSPLDAGFEGNLCSALRGDTLGNVLNYRVAADFVQPRLFGTRTSTTLNLFAERTSELKTYLRTTRGGRLAAVREVAPQTLASGAVNVTRGRTLAEPIFFCFSLEVCTTEVIDTLRQSRWSNFLSAAVIRDRTASDVYPTGGYQVRTTLDWATRLLGSDDRYLRLFGDATAYRQIRRGWVLAGRLQAGTFLEGLIEDRGYIPPERRFFLGGPNSVRGFERNALGPRVYVEAVRPGSDEEEEPDTIPFAVGGTRMALASLELRMPAPVLRENLRIAAFVDGGRVWASGADTLVRGPKFRITPGLGLRFLTPVGPIRFDAAYNPYPGEIGPLYRLEGGSLVLVDPEYDPGSKFVNRIQFYLAVGQAF
ncbi:MAG TPA: BamA/TamA family outer membrane protein, partial [Longimicrobiaceae bacterium]|nr:BamA/TamA family outer membrane protein [Longimicrobiaceae bacterium]